MPTAAASISIIRSRSNSLSFFFRGVLVVKSASVSLQKSTMNHENSSRSLLFARYRLAPPSAAGDRFFTTSSATTKSNNIMEGEAGGSSAAVETKISAMKVSDQTSGAKLSCWYGTLEKKEAPKFPKFLEKDDGSSVDVCVIGGGMAGLCTAYGLLREGKRVAILEDGEIGSGESGRTTAHLFSYLDDRLYNIKYLHGIEGATLASLSHQAAVDWFERVIQDENIDCDFERLYGYLIDKTPGGTSLSEELRLELEVSQEVGFKDVIQVPSAPFDGLPSGPCLRYPRQAQFHPLKFMYGLAEALKKRGCSIYTQTHAEDWGFNTARERSSKEMYVTTHDRLALYADHVVLATNVPLQTLKMIAKLTMDRSYVVAAEIPKQKDHYLIWDTYDPYHYVRFTKWNKEKDLIIIGGEDHMVGKELDTFEERYAKLYNWAKARWPTIGNIVYQWSGQIIEPADAIGYIGKNPHEENVYIITGDSGNGMTNSAIAGFLIPDIITKNNKYLDYQVLYDPIRKSLKKLPSLLGHLMDANAQYKLWFERGDVQDVEDIVPDSGGVLRKGVTEPIAVYRDGNGKLHACSAVCRHMKGIVRWNPAEKTWDCPVHGSRYDCFGKVINGPAYTDLPPAPIP